MPLIDDTPSLVRADKFAIKMDCHQHILTHIFAHFLLTITINTHFCSMRAFFTFISPPW
jgi:hypothetical protein